MPTKPEPSASPQLGLQFELPLPMPMPLRPPTGDTAPTPAGTLPERRRLIQFDAQVLEYVLKRSRRRTIGFAIDEHGLTVTAPKWVTLAQIDVAIRDKQRWIFTKIAEVRARRQGVPKVSWEDGGILPFLGAPLTLRVAPGGRAAVRFDATLRELHIALPPSATTQQLKDRVQGWLQAEARLLFAERLNVYAERLGVRHRVLRLSSASTRWGSCSADGKILLNWRLVHFPLSSIDYVVAHELAHLKEMNHGPRFWQTVAELLPGFETARAHLKNPPPELLPTL